MAVTLPDKIIIDYIYHKMIKFVGILYNINHKLNSNSN